MYIDRSIWQHRFISVLPKKYNVKLFVCDYVNLTFVYTVPDFRPFYHQLSILVDKCQNKYRYRYFSLIYINKTILLIDNRIKIKLFGNNELNVTIANTTRR
jgi:hypothetical protein